jgi:hypothetical protein
LFFALAGLKQILLFAQKRSPIYCGDEPDVVSGKAFDMTAWQWLAVAVQPRVPVRRTAWRLIF